MSNLLFNAVLEKYSVYSCFVVVPITFNAFLSNCFFSIEAKSLLFFDVVPGPCTVCISFIKSITLFSSTSFNSLLTFSSNFPTYSQPSAIVSGFISNIIFPCKNHIDCTVEDICHTLI